MIYNYKYENNFDDLRDTVEATAEAIKSRRGEFDSIVVRGTSGIVVGSPVSLMTDLPLVIVRKPGDTQHTKEAVINVLNLGKRCLFLDDFRSSGATEEAVRSAVVREGAWLEQCYFYNNRGDAGDFRDPQAAGALCATTVLV